MEGSAGALAAASTLRVLFGLYPSARFNRGGKEQHIADMYLELTKLGLDIHKLDPWDWGSATPYDVFHIFGAEYYQHEMAVCMHAMGCKIVVSPILVYPDRRTEQRTRWWRYVDPLVPVATTFSLRRDLLRRADAILSGARTETAQLVDLYGVRPAAIRPVPLAVSATFADATPELFLKQVGIDDPVLSVGRIEPRKNTLRLIQAMKPLGLPLVLIGGFDETQRAYCDRVRAEIAANPWVTHLGRVDDAMLASAHAAARVHVLVSHNETPGLVSLEAGLAGANVVTSPLPYIVEYLGDAPWYARPTDVGHITAQIQAAYAAPRTGELRQRILDHYTTKAVAAQIRDVYRELLG